MTITPYADDEIRAERKAVLDRQRAEHYGRVDYWNAPGWRRERAIDAQECESEKWWREHDRIAGDKFFTLIRERLPNLLTMRSISISAIKKYEQAIKDVLLSVGCRPSRLRLLEWPVVISSQAHQEFGLWTIRMDTKYDGPENLLPDRRSFDEIYREMYGDEGGATR